MTIWVKLARLLCALFFVIENYYIGANKKQNKMSKEKTKIEFEGKEYIFEDLNEEQQKCVKHLADIEQKLQSVVFNYEQLEFSRLAFQKQFKKLIELDND